ncbi:MAG: response regulator transcription factor [Bacteroidales bacterium]|nr:response regulator transcription factor [Bacteroidales bacterium]
MKPLVSVLIVEPSEIICNGLKSILEEAGGYNVLAAMHDASMLEERLPAVRPDVLIVNPTLLSSTPRQQLAALSQLRPSMPIVALVYQYVERPLMDYFNHIIDIRQNRSSILSTISDALSATKEKPVKQEIQENYELSDRETDVLVLVAKGLSSKEIADKLSISVHTVNSHRKNITHKTGIKSVAGLAVYAMIHNLMED